MEAIEIEAEVDENNEIHIKVPEGHAHEHARVRVVFEKEKQRAGPRRRVFGQFRGKARMRDDFNEPLSDSFWLDEDK
jgi:hypothetical protein